VNLQDARCNNKDNTINSSSYILSYIRIIGAKLFGSNVEGNDCVVVQVVRSLLEVTETNIMIL